MDKLRAVIIGTGGIAQSHVAALRASGERTDLVAAMDIDRDRVSAFCETHEIPRHYTDVDTMLQQEQPQLVHIATPPGTHCELSIAALEAGAWVLCEKPLCASLAEFDRIAAAEQRTGRRTASVFQMRFATSNLHVRRLLHAGTFGRPLVAVCNTLWYRTQDYYNVGWRGKWKTEVGGPTMSLGIHLMDLLLWLLDDWREVQAMTATLDHTIEVEDISMALVRFGSGAMATITNSALSPRQESYLRFDFQKATVEVSTLYRYSNEHWRFSLPPDVADPLVSEQWTALSEDFSGSHATQLGEILDSMARNERPPVNGAEARRILEYAASLYKSANTGLVVKQGEITPDDPYYRAMNGDAS